MIHDASKLCLMLRDIYPSNQWAHVTEFVQEHEGQVRRLDALAFGYRPQTGYALVGFEAKISKADLANELRNPEKWFAARQFCDAFHLVTGWDYEPDSRIPAEWGVLAVNSDGELRQVRAATPLQPLIRNRHPLLRDLVGAFMDRLLFDPDAKRNHIAHRVRDAEQKAHAAGMKEGIVIGEKRGRRKAIDELTAL